MMIRKNDNTLDAFVLEAKLFAFEHDDHVTFGLKLAVIITI